MRVGELIERLREVPEYWPVEIAGVDEDGDEESLLVVSVRETSTFAGPAVVLGVTP